MPRVGAQIARCKRAVIPTFVCICLPMGEQRQRTAVISRVTCAQHPSSAPDEHRHGGLATRVRMLAIVRARVLGRADRHSAAAAASRPHDHTPARTRAAPRGSCRTATSEAAPTLVGEPPRNIELRRDAQRRSGRVPRAEGDHRQPGKAPRLNTPTPGRAATPKANAANSRGRQTATSSASADVGNTLAVTVTASDAERRIGGDIEPLGDRPRGRRRRRDRLGRRLVRQSRHDLQDARRTVACADRRRARRDPVAGGERRAAATRCSTAAKRSPSARTATASSATTARTTPTSTKRRDVPVEQELSNGQIVPLTGIRSLSPAGDHVVALLKNGTVKTWGSNGSGPAGPRHGRL